jgi:protein ImuB
LQFSPRVTQLEGAVLVEVQASERLFGGRKALLNRVRAECAELQVQQMAVAPTALAARALLRCMPLTPRESAAATNHTFQVSVAACTPRHLSAVLDGLPIHALWAVQAHQATLLRLGCNRLGQVRALPRGGVSRRFGAPLLLALDHAYGLVSETYAWITLPEQFRLSLEFNSRVEVAEGLMFGANRLLGSLKAWLQARQCGVTSICLHWEHDLQRRSEAKAGSLMVHTGQASRDTQHLARLLAEHLSRTELVAPVVAITLEATGIEAMATVSNSLLPEDNASGESLLQLMERLSARLGPERVLRGTPLADHRPQRMQSWQACTGDVAKRKTPPQASVPSGMVVPSHWASYPPWILRKPLRLAVVKDKPVYQGPLQMMAGPERIETGWWPEGAEGIGSNRLVHPDLTLRDYFIANSELAGLLWIYRQRSGLLRTSAKQPVETKTAKTHGQPDEVRWYLQGIYG